MSRAQVTPERIAEIRARIENLCDRGAHICAAFEPSDMAACARCGYTSDAHAIRDLLTALEALGAWQCSTCGARFAETVPPASLEGVARCSSCVRAESAERQLATWREWAQFVYGPGGPVEGSDDDLRFRVCAAHEHDKSALQGQLATVTQERDEAQRAKYGTPCKCESWIETCGQLEAERNALKQERDAMRAALRPFAVFFEKWTAKPLRNVDDAFYTIHAGEDGASLRLSDCERAARALGGEER